MTRLLFLAERVLSLSVGVFAAIFFAFGAYAVAWRVASPWSFMPVLPGVVLRLTAVLIFSLLYLVVLLRRYRGKAVWALGLNWGFSELVWNAEVAFIAPALIAPEEKVASWWLYMGAVLLLFSISAWRLRGDMRKTRLAAAMVVCVLLFTPVRVAFVSALAPGASAFGSSPFDVMTSEIPEYALIISTVLLLVKGWATGQ